MPLLMAATCLPPPPLRRRPPVRAILPRHRLPLTCFASARAILTNVALCVCGQRTHLQPSPAKPSRWTAAGGTLPANRMGHLEDAFKIPAEDIIYVLNVQLTKMNHRDTMKAFTIMNACSGVTTCIDGAASVDDAATAFVQRHRTRKTKPTASGAAEAVTVPDLKAVLGKLNANDEGLKPELVRKVFMAAQLGKAAEERTVRMALPVSVCSP